ncbi:MAG: hypothetical protein AMXMBFR58_11350 [Phycisphaerae bacterium]
MTDPTPTSTTSTMTPVGSHPSVVAGSTGVHACWPVERFYWALLDVPVVAPGPLPQALEDELADLVPVAVEDLHAVVTPVTTGSARGIGQAAVCAVPRAMLDQLPSAARSLTPSGVPGFLVGVCEAGQFNLLVGAYEPRALRAQRRRALLVGVAAMVAVSSLACIGLLRREIAWDAAARDASLAHEQLLASSSITVKSDDPFALAREIDRLRRATDARAVPTLPRDAALSLADLLRAWPASIEAEPKSITVRPEGVWLTVEIQGSPDAFLGAFTAPEGWSLDEPRVSSVRGVATLNLQLKPAGPAHPVALGGGR